MKTIIANLVWRYVVWSGIVLLGKSDPPPAPDYTGAAQATAAGNLEAARVAAAANRVNQVTPTGNLTYTAPQSVVDQAGYNAALAAYAKKPYGTKPNISDFTTVPDNGWTATQTLSPSEQAKLDKNNALSIGLLDTAGKGLSSVDQLLSDTSLDESKLAQPSIQGKAVQDAIMERLRPELDREQAGLDNQLANQGIMQGSEAWGTAQDKQAQSKNDLLTQAALQGINTGNAARQQGITEQYAAQSRPLDIVNALRTGNQVQNPNFVNVPQQQTTAGADLLGAAQGNYNAAMGQYNAQQAGSNNLLSGLFSLGGAGITKYSDRLLKTNIKRIGTHESGLPWYSFDYVWGGHAEGVMADEVMEVNPMAVHYDKSGYKMVDYGMLNHG